MPLLSVLSSLWRNLLHKGRVEQELTEEVHTYLEMLIEAKVSEGLKAEEARRAALIELGGVEQIKESVREVRMGQAVETIWQDLRYGFRVMRKAPGFTAIAALSLALGIGANTALFSILDAMLLRMLPVKEPGRLVLFRSMSPPEFSPGHYSGYWDLDPATGQNVLTSFPYQSLLRMREQPSGLSDLFAFGDVSLSVSADGQVDVASGQAVSGNYYAGLGVQAVLGRTLTDEDDQAAAAPVAVLSYRYWQRRFGGDAAVIGKQVNLNSVAFTVVGVTPPAFDGTMQVGSTEDVTVPLAWEPQLYPDPKNSQMNDGQWWLRLMGRLRPGITAEQARAELEGAFIQSVIEHRAVRQAQARAGGGNAIQDLAPKDYPRLYLGPGGRGEMDVRRRYTPSLYLLFGVVGLVLLIACANVANLLLGRAATRQKEIGLRLALGASRGRLVRQLLTESLLLAGLSGALGIVFALWIKNGLLAVSDWEGPGMRALEPRLDWRVLGFTMGLSLLTGVVFGLAPAWRAAKVDLMPALKESGRGSSAMSRSLLNRGLIVLQVALSLVLLVGAGLFVRTLVNLQGVGVGFNTQNLLLFEAKPGLVGYKDDRAVSLYQELSERLEAVPGVRKVTFSGIPLLAQFQSTRGVYLRGGLTAAPDAEGRVRASGQCKINHVRENFLDVMEIPLLAGRMLERQDDARAPKVVVVNETFARQFFPKENPVGKRFTFDPAKPDEVEIVGLAGDAKYTRQRDEIAPTAYVPWQQWLPAMEGSATFEVRTASDPSSVVAAIRQAVREVDANLPLDNVRTQADQADQVLVMERLFAKLVTLFGLLAQQLAAVGLFGVMAYSVTQRTQEIGIRMALGARPADVLKMILRQGMALVLIGVVLGLAGAYGLSKYLESRVGLSQMLYGVRPSDPSTYGLVAALLTLVSFVACYIPARRATKVNPMVTLRFE
jgi:predicted permease